MKTIDQALVWIGRALAVLATIVGAVIMLVMIVDIVARNVSGHSIAGVYELTETLVVLILAFGMLYGEQLRTNPRVTLWTDRLSARGGMIVRTIGEAVVAVVVVWMAYGVIGQAIAAAARSEHTQGIIRFPVWPTKMLLAIGFAGLALYAVNRVIWSIRRLAAGRIDEKTEYAHVL